MSRALVVTEIALSFGLLVAAGLMTRSILEVRNFDPGFAVDGRLVATLSLPQADYPEPEQVHAFFEELTSRVRALSESPSLSKSMPNRPAESGR